MSEVIQKMATVISFDYEHYYIFILSVSTVSVHPFLWINLRRRAHELDNYLLKLIVILEEGDMEYCCYVMVWPT